jgi:hypothetical protein
VSTTPSIQGRIPEAPHCCTLRCETQTRWQINGLFRGAGGDGILAENLLHGRRREFIAGLGSAAVWPLAARAQQSEQMRRISVLMAFGESDPEAKAHLAGFTQGLSEFSRFAIGRLLKSTNVPVSALKRQRVPPRGREPDAPVRRQRS